MHVGGVPYVQYTHIIIIDGERLTWEGSMRKLDKLGGTAQLLTECSPPPALAHSVESLPLRNLGHCWERVGTIGKINTWKKKIYKLSACVRSDKPEYLIVKMHS